MKTKRIAAGVLCAVLSLSMTTACSGTGGASENTQNTTAAAETAKPKEAELHTLFIRAPKKFSEITATFLNTASKETTDIEMKKESETDSAVTFSCEADVNLYNMVHIKSGETQSFDVAFNRFTSGWNFENNELLPYAEGKEPVYDPKFETKVFRFDGYDKNVYIWTPADYDEKAAEKYSVIYMFDGQSVLTTGVDKGMDNDAVCWNVSENVESMMAVSDNKAIIVAVDNNSVYRWDELVPDLGEINNDGAENAVKVEDLTHKRGSAFAEFICETVMPYINETYNVYTDAQHTSLAGSSLGGLETFYTVLSYPDKFGTGGVMSATFDMYAEKEWTKFLSDKLNMENAPLLYMYAGSCASDNGDVTEKMYNALIEKGYAKDKIVFSKYEPGEHLINYWRNIYPEFLEAAFTKNVSALEFGVPVHYEDTSDPFQEYLKEMEIDLENIEPGYVYYDNSETKWENVYAYWWGGMSINSVTKESYYFSEWPGIKMEQIEGTDIYRIVAPFGVTGGIIFDSGVTDREVAEGKEAYQTVDLEYSTETIGKIYKIDISVEPKTDSGTMKTKHRYPEGAWSDYSEKQ